jgi:hypothetical protein
MRNTYTRLKLERLVQIMDDISTRSEGKAEYKCLVDYLQALRVKMQELIQHFAAKNSSGRLGTIDRTKCKSEVFDLFYKIFDALELNCNNDPFYIEFLGLELQSTTRKAKEVTVFGGKPTIKSVKNTFEFGQLQVELEPVSGVHIYGIEWSADGGVTRHNGQYSAEPTLTIKVTPHSEIMVWAFAVGNVDEKSELSEPMIARSL